MKYAIEDSEEEFALSIDDEAYEAGNVLVTIWQQTVNGDKCHWEELAQITVELTKLTDLIERIAK